MDNYKFPSKSRTASTSQSTASTPQSPPHDIIISTSSTTPPPPAPVFSSSSYANTTHHHNPEQRFHTPQLLTKQQQQQKRIAANTKSLLQFGLNRKRLLTSASPKMVPSPSSLSATEDDPDNDGDSDHPTRRKMMKKKEINTRSLGEQLSDVRRIGIREFQRVETPPAWVDAVDDLVAPSSKNVNVSESYGKMFKQSKQELEWQLKQEEEEQFRAGITSGDDNDDIHEDSGAISPIPELRETPEPGATPSSVASASKSQSQQQQKQLRTFHQSIQRDQLYRETEVRKKFENASMRNQVSPNSNSRRMTLLTASPSSSSSASTFQIRSKPSPGVSFVVTTKRSKSSSQQPNSSESRELSFQDDRSVGSIATPFSSSTYNNNNSKSVGTRRSVSPHHHRGHGATSADDIQEQHRHPSITSQLQLHQRTAFLGGSRRQSAVSFAKLVQEEEQEKMTKKPTHYSSLESSFISGAAAASSSLNSPHDASASTPSHDGSISPPPHRTILPKLATSSSSSSNNAVIWDVKSMEREDLRDMRRQKLQSGNNNTYLNNSNTTMMLSSASTNPFHQQQQQQFKDQLHSSPFGGNRENTVDVSTSPQMQKWMNNIRHIAMKNLMQQDLDAEDDMMTETDDASINRERLNSLMLFRGEGGDSSDLQGIASGFAAALLSGNSSFTFNASSGSNTGNNSLLPAAMASRKSSLKKPKNRGASSSPTMTVLTVDGGSTAGNQTPTAWTPGTAGYLPLPEYAKSPNLLAKEAKTSSSSPLSLSHNVDDDEHRQQRKVEHTPLEEGIVPLLSKEKSKSSPMEDSGLDNDDDDEEHTTARYNDSRTKAERFKQDTTKRSTTPPQSTTAQSNNNDQQQKRRRSSSVVLQDVEMLDTVVFDETQRGMDLSRLVSDEKEKEAQEDEQERQRRQERRFYADDDDDDSDEDDDDGLDTTTAISHALNPELAKLPPFEILLKKFLECKEICKRHNVSDAPTVNSYNSLKLRKHDLNNAPPLCPSSTGFAKNDEPALSVAAVALSRFVTDESIADAPSRLSGEGESVSREVEAEIMRWFRPWRPEFRNDKRTIRNSDAIATMPVSSLRDMKEQRDMIRKIATNKKDSRKKELVFKLQEIIQKQQTQASSAAAAEEMKQRAKTRLRSTMTAMFDPMCEVLRDLWKHFHVPFADRTQFEDWNMRSVSSLNMWVVSREITLYLAVKGSATDTLIRLINSRKSIVDRLFEVASHPLFSRAERAWKSLEKHYEAALRGDRSPPRLRNVFDLADHSISAIEMEQLGLEFLGLILALRRISSEVISALVLSNSLPYTGPRIKLRDLEDQYLWSMRSDLIKAIGDTPLMRLLSMPHPLEKRKRPVVKKALTYWERVIEATSSLFRGKAVPLSHENVFILPETAQKRLTSEANEAVRALVDKKHREWRAQARAAERMEKQKNAALRSGDNPFGSFTATSHFQKYNQKLTGSPTHSTASPKSVSFNNNNNPSSFRTQHSGSIHSLSGRLDVKEIKQLHKRNSSMAMSMQQHGSSSLNNINNNNMSSVDLLKQSEQQQQQEEIDLELLDKANTLLRESGSPPREPPRPGSIQLSKPNVAKIESRKKNKKKNLNHHQQQLKFQTSPRNPLNDDDDDDIPLLRPPSASVGSFKPLFGKAEPRGLSQPRKMIPQSVKKEATASSIFNLDEILKENNPSETAGDNHHQMRRTRSVSIVSHGDENNNNGRSDITTLRISGGNNNANNNSNNNNDGPQGIEISVRAVQKALELHQQQNFDPLAAREREKELTIEAILRSQTPDFLTKTEKCRLIVIKNGDSGLRKEFVVEVPVKVARDKNNLSKRQLRLYANATKQVADTISTHPTYKIDWLTCEEEDEQTSKPRQEYFEMMERARIQKERQLQRDERSKATMVLGDTGEIVEVPPYQYPDDVLASSGHDNSKPPEVEALSRLSSLEEFVLRLRRSLDPDILRKTLVINDTNVCDEKVRAVLNVTLPPMFSQHRSQDNNSQSKGLGASNSTSGPTLSNARAKKHPEEIAGYVQSPVFEFTKDTKNMTFRPVSNEVVLSLSELESSLEKFVGLSRERLLRTACKKVARGCKRKLTGTIFGSLKDILKRDREEKAKALAAANDDDNGEEGFVEWLIEHGTIDYTKANVLRQAFSSAWEEAGKFNIEQLPGIDETRKQHFLNYVIGELSGKGAVREQEDHDETDEIWRTPVVSSAQAELLSQDQLERKIVAHDVEVKPVWPRHMMPSKVGDTFLFSNH